MTDVSLNQSRVPRPDAEPVPAHVKEAIGRLGDVVIIHREDDPKGWAFLDGEVVPMDVEIAYEGDPRRIKRFKATVRRPA